MRPAQSVVVFFYFSVGRAFVFVVLLGKSHDVGFRLKTTRTVPCRIVFDPRTAAVMGGDEHSQQEVGGYEGEDPVAEVNEPVATIIKAAEDQPG